MEKLTKPTPKQTLDLWLLLQKEQQILRGTRLPVYRKWLSRHAIQLQAQICQVWVGPT